jgi:hypothetical protein
VPRWRGSPELRVVAALRTLAVDLFGVITSLYESIVEFFPTRDEAEAFIATVDQDEEPDLAGTLRVEPVEFETTPN